MLLPCMPGCVALLFNSQPRNLLCLHPSTHPTLMVPSPATSSPPPPPCPLQDKWHHEEDVIAGFSLGLLMAWLFYRQAYGSVMGPHAGMLTSAVRGGSGGRLVASGSSSRFPLYGGSGSEGADEQALYASADDKV